MSHMSRMSRESWGHFFRKSKLMSHISCGSHGSHGSKNPSLIWACHACHVCHGFHGDLRVIFCLKSKCMSHWSHGSKNPKLSCTLCHNYDCHACHTCHACHRDLVLEFSDKNTKTMSQVHVTHASHTCIFFALSWSDLTSQGLMYNTDVQAFPTFWFSGLLK